MKKAVLTGITEILPFNKEYIKVGNKKGLWNLMDAEGKLVGDTWFETIGQNNDGSIEAKVKTNKTSETVKFIDVNDIKVFGNVAAFIPAEVVNIVEPDSIKPITNKPGYIATATFYGMKVYITKDGKIYDKDGKRLNIMFNTVDTKRLNKALWGLNRKIYGKTLYKFVDDSWYTTIKKHWSIFGFYWIDDEYLNMRVGCKDEVFREGTTKKWTDSLIIRATKNMPEGILSKLSGVWGEPSRDDVGKYNENYTWKFGKDKLNYIIDTVNNI